jgi:ATP-dependent Clp protease ATP-binding subunit ClpX
MVDQPELGSVPLSSHLSDQTVIEKSNVLLLGPSGVGKTYILSTLARVLEVPFATVDCSALTQAGYIGTDIESSIERLLLAAGNSVQKCETGIIFFDEVDKLAKPAVMTHGRDVSGEGVQQGLLKMIEGTTVTVNAKSDRTSKTESSPSRVRDRAGREATSGPPPASGKSEQCTIDTRNILFVFAGAFVGLEKIIASRLSSGSSIGFGAQLKSGPPSPSSSSSSSSSPTTPNPLDAVLPTDLQTYGLIPELLGRIPVITSLHPLTQSQLVSILTEPRNSLVKQYTALFNTYGIQLRFTTPALHAIAARALSSSNPSKSSSPSSSTSPSSTPSGIGARGLRATLESVLGEIMFWGPGSGIRFCLVDEAFVRAGETSSSSPPTSSDREREKDLPPCWSRGQGRLFEDAYEKEEEAYRRRERGEREDEQGVVHDVQSFERYREVGRSGM